MLTPDVKITGFTAAEWIRLGDLLSARQRGAPASGSRGGLFAITTGNRLRKLFTTRDGRLDPISESWPSDLASLCARHRARWGLRMNVGALDELMERFGERLTPEQDYTQQTLMLIGVLSELEAEGALETWPHKISSWPIPTDRLILTALDTVCPDGKALVIGAFEGGELETSLAARRRGRGFDSIVGPSALRDQMGLLSGDWTRDYLHLARAVEQQLGPLALGCFGQTPTFMRLMSDRSPGAWAAAVAARDVILSPITPAVAVPLGMDLGRAALETVRHVAERIGANSWFSSDGPLASALDRVTRVATERDLLTQLGFDPLGLIERLLGARRD